MHEIAYALKRRLDHFNPERPHYPNYEINRDHRTFAPGGCLKVDDVMSGSDRRTNVV